MATLLLAKSRPATGFGLRQSLTSALAVWRQRRDLAALSADRLRDIGLTKADALREASRPAWDLPR